MSPKENIQNTIHADGTEISVISFTDEREDYISLTDLAKHRNSEEPNIVVGNWMRNRSTIEFLGLWENLNNPNFNPIEFEGVKNKSGGNAFTLSPKKWIVSTGAIGLISKSGRYSGGTYAHKDIAFEFASWLSPEFKLYVIKDYQRLKQDESYKLSLEWNVKRILSKANYRIHTDAIKENLIPPNLTKQQQGYIYADEADIINVVMFGKTASQWRKENPDLKGNIRDYATIEQLLVLSNLENINALLVKQGIPQRKRLEKLRQMAIEQLTQIAGSKSANTLNDLHNNLKLPNG